MVHERDRRPAHLDAAVRASDHVRRARPLQSLPYEEAATDLGATNWQKVREVTLPILLPGIIGVALFGFTLSYDEIARTALAAGSTGTPCRSRSGR